MKLTASVWAAMASVCVAMSCHGEQAIVSPCRDAPTTSITESCPACAEDSDCVVISNTCQETATCAPAAGNWAVVSIGCSPALEFVRPPDSECVCIDSVCQERP